MPRVIDVHAHYAPLVMLNRIRNGESWFGAEMFVEPDGRQTVRIRGREGMTDPRFELLPSERVADMDRIGTDVQVLSPMPVLFNYDIGADEALDSSRQLNDDIRETVAAFPDRFRGLDGALRTLAEQDYGTLLLTLVALGIAAYGVFSFIQARYRKV